MEVSPILIPITLLVSVPVSVIGVVLVRAFQRRFELQARRTALSPELAERLDRTEHAMDAIAVEVERMSEAQRFTTRRLSDRAGGSAALGEGRRTER